MAAGAAPFFPPRAARPVLAFVLNDFPYPLALTYRRLHEAMDRQEPVAAAWLLRDAFECLLKFSASLALADFLHADPAPDAAAALVALLLKWQGLSIGDWHTILKDSLVPLEPFVREGRADESRRLVPELYTVFFETKGKRRPSALSRLIDGDERGFTRWRNRVFGHGVFHQDQQWYADETTRWLANLHQFYEGLRPVLEGWLLVNTDAAGEDHAWTGAVSAATVPHHQHVPAGAPLPMALARSRPDEAGRLPFGPLLSVQPCVHCHQPTAFFFDRNTYDRKKDSHRTSFVEYFGGHDGELRDWGEVRQLTGLLPTTFSWQRTSYDREEVAGGIQATFRDFAREYRPPDYLLERFWAVVDAPGHVGGYVRLTGSAGTGKTYFVRGVAEDGRERGVPVLTYHVLSGALSDYRTFVGELSDRAREHEGLRYRTQEMQSKGAAYADLSAQFREFVGELMRANRVETLVIAIDGLDELPEPAPGEAAITTFLPPLADLPAGCFVLLTSRETLRPRIRADVDRLRAGAGAPGQEGGAFADLAIAPDGDENRELLRSYLRERLSAPFRSPAAVTALLERAGGTFLYAFHLCRALESGVYDEVADLPPASRFYADFLARLRDRVGDQFFVTVYRPTLILLAAAAQPITLGQLQRWGVPRERLEGALLDLGDFLRAHRSLPYTETLATAEGENRFALAHEDFGAFVRDDEDLSTGLREAHAAIAGSALARWRDDWASLDPADDAALYDLRFTEGHLHAADCRDKATALRADEGYAAACLSAGLLASGEARERLAAELCGRAATLYTALVDECGRTDLARSMATARLNEGAALNAQGLLSEAIAALDAVVAAHYRFADTHAPTGLTRAAVAALHHKGIVLAKAGQLEESLATFDAALVMNPESANDRDRASYHDLMASLLSNQGQLLRLLGRLEEALEVQEAAIAIREQLLDHPGEGGAEQLATAIEGKAMTLYDLARLPEAIAAHDEAIATFRPLVQDGGRQDLIAHLATAFMNKGLAIIRTGNAEDFQAGLAAFETAVAALQGPALEDGREELVHTLALTLTNRGRVLAQLERHTDADADFAMAVAIARRLVDAGREDLRGNLAETLAEQGRALARLGHGREALGRYAEALQHWDVSLSAGHTYMTPHVVATLRDRVMVLLDDQQWDLAATDLVRILNHLDLMAGELTHLVAVLREMSDLFERLYRLADVEVDALYAALGPHGEHLHDLCLLVWKHTRGQPAP